MASVELANINKSYGSVEVLRNLNLKIEEGEFVALVGPSGCGKSTLLRIIAGLDESNEGDVIMDGKWVNHLTPKQRNIAMVFQSYALYPHMSVFDNIGFNLKLSGISKTSISDKVTEVARILNLEDLLERKPSQLSGGQRQRVALSRALVRDPDVFLFDEPLSNLDAKLRVQMRDEIKSLHQKVRTTSIYVTHDQIEAMTLADRIVILNNGVIQQMGAPIELYENPENAFVAGFIGSPSMNFMDGVLHKNSVCLSDGTRLLTERGKKFKKNEPVKVGIRPEHLMIDEKVKTGKRLRGSVELIEPTGAQNHVKIRVAENLITAIDMNLTKFHIGQSVKLRVEPEHVHIFSAS